ncbi:Acyl-phosphate:glycerol-3-phosphate O-acyltransferase PlsY [uncultured Candidatus Thioglobus sp.]|nr:Acyl-phosphate:glycerol-3-phosphate O-acyltransferase PlsY [uncultured Candidatus Thioglobus sp.]
MLVESLLIVCAYFLGSVSFALVFCKLLRLDDPRLHGSKNPGATNVMRLYGKKIAIATLIGDLLKGMLPILIGQWLSMSDLVIASIGLFVFLGHLFPVFFNFKGGKGVATLLGVLLGFTWLWGVAFIVTWLIIQRVFTYSSVASLIASAMTPLYGFMLGMSDWYMLISAILVVLLFWRHKQNIKDLLSGIHRASDSD